MNTRHTQSRVSRFAAAGAVVVAGAVSGVIGVGALVDANPSTPALRADSDEHRAIVDFARTNGLTGLSPASLAPHPSELARRADELSGIAEFARTNGLTGLSPASMGPPASAAGPQAAFAVEQYRTCLPGGAGSADALERWVKNCRRELEQTIFPEGRSDPCVPQGAGSADALERWVENCRRDVIDTLLAG
jgi:hypothetical protein